MNRFVAAIRRFFEGPSCGNTGEITDHTPEREALARNGEAAFDQGNYDAALADFQKAAAFTDKMRTPLEWAYTQFWIARILQAKQNNIGAIPLRNS